MDHIQNRPMDVRSIVAKENVNSLSHAQSSSCEWCRRFSSCIAGISCCTRQTVYFNPEANVGGDLETGVGGMDVDLHIGIEGGGAYAQIGPLVKIPDTGEVDYGVSGKAGYGFGPGYTELSFVSYDDDTSINLKVGGKFQL